MDFVDGLRGNGDETSDSDSVVSTPLFSPASTARSSSSSYEDGASVRSASPSVMSMTSSLQQLVYREEYGRSLNNFCDIYRLPGDAEEMARLDKQHLLLIEVMGGKYPPPMTEILSEITPGKRKAVLDLGCGSGGWIIDVAVDFPHVDAVGVDLIPMQSLSMPPNLRSEVDDINLGLEHFNGDFDVVHSRLISCGIRDYGRLVDEISRVVRPGGLIELGEMDFHTYDINRRRIDLSTTDIGPPHWSRWLTFLRKAACSLGGDVDAATHLFHWVSTHPAFEDVVYREFWFPIIPSRSDIVFHNRITRTVKDIALAFLRSGRPLLLGTGLPEEIVNELESHAKEELNARSVPQYARLQCVYARKKCST